MENRDNLHGSPPVEGMKPWSGPEEEQFSLLDTILIITSHIRMVVLVATAGLIMGLGIALFSPSEYTSSAKVIRETSTNSGAGLAGLSAFRVLGLTWDLAPLALRRRPIRPL